MVKIGYHELGNFHMGVIFMFFALLSSLQNYPHEEIKPICLYEGNRSSIVKITPSAREMSCQHFREIFPQRK